jgi:RNA polymerase sigma-70 factor (ECF subfamily)
MSGPTPETVRTLVENHRQFRAFLEQRVGNPADAEEILQTAFLKTVERGDAIRDEESAVAWFYRLLRNALIDYYRHRGAEDKALIRAAGFSQELAESEPEVERAICQCMHHLLPTLREDYATLLRRIDLGDASVTELAAETGMTPNNVRVKLHRARIALRRQLVRSCGSCTEHGCLDCTCRASPRHPP